MDLCGCAGVATAGGVGGMAAPAIGSPVQSVVALRPVRLGSGVSRCWLGSSARPNTTSLSPSVCLLRRLCYS